MLGRDCGLSGVVLLLGRGLLSLQLGPGLDGFVGPVLQVTDQRPDVVQGMKHITAAGDLCLFLLVPGAEPRGVIGDGGFWSEASVHQFQQPHAPKVSASRRSSGLSKKQWCPGGTDPHQDGIGCLEDLIEKAN